MPYDPTNNPYIPGDPYSYDLKWVVEQLEYAISLYTPLSADFQELHDYVMNYFDNLDLSQEVSDKIDEMVSDGTFADLLQIMFDAYEADIDRAIELQNEAITILENRMDTFASLPPGSTAGNAELLDIRVEYDGQIATSAGNAVRGQINELHSLYNTLLNAAFITDQASGPIASFPDGADYIPPKRAVFNIDPVQDLHGYSTPWPAGSGKNKFDKDADDPSNGFISGQYIISVGLTVTPADPTEWNVSEYIPVSPSTTYTLSGLTTFPIQPPAFCQYRANQSFITGDSYTGSTFTFTTEADAAFIRISIPTANESVLQLEAGSTVTAYEPYSNICPISGWTGAEITAKGVNLWDEEYDNIPTAAAPQYEAIYVGGGIYTLSTTAPLNTGGNTNLFLLSGNVSSGASSGTNGVSIGNSKTVIATGGYVTIAYRNYMGVDPREYNTQLEAGSTATTYEPSVGTTHDITWQDEAGTVYGGTISYLGGGQWRLKKTMESVDMGDLTWTYDTTTLSVPVFYSSNVPSKKLGSDNMISPWYKIVSSRSYLVDNDFALAPWNSSNSGQLGVRDSRYTDAAAFTTAVTGTQLVYELATPTYYTITGGPNLITLLGANNIFSDTGDADITYRADPTLYLAGH